ncbi:hypothetical protein IscW_ISCW022784 [Ixodes scapularis]|uniref:Uncharacterized protein n=1 Tax=Ixodes scapularis TaxID=6945 RepID=B7QCQ8_IXOSC|nr:hypothetical protein IscW_ISCW022784 [Ixodes scapularis]|eukprot:XP_002413322.1 hypothetical protein IscW_ISCW022784 [Ixodes scapularis]
MRHIVRVLSIFYSAMFLLLLIHTYFMASCVDVISCKLLIYCFEEEKKALSHPRNSR